MSKEYKAESMIKNSRHINYFNTLDKSIQNNVINYGELDGIDFQRTKTLCYGDDECNFIFIKHNKDEKFTRTEAR